MNTPAYGSPEWLEWRRHGVGASEMGALAGADPYRGEYAVWLEKRGEGEPFGGNAATSWGHKVEGLALDAYEEMTGRHVIRGETFSDPRWPHLWATLDARWEDVNVEVKATTRWTEPPAHVLLQVQAQMGIAGLAETDIVRVSPYGEPLVTTVPRDDDLIVDLLDMSEAWYVRYVEGDEMPPVDASQAASRYLDRVRGPEEMVASAEQAALVASLQGVRDALRRAEEDEKRLVNQLKASMAGAEALRGPGFRIAWRPTKERVSVDWHKVAHVMYSLAGIPPETYDAEVARHTTVSEGTRPFRVSFDEPEEEATA